MSLWVSRQQEGDRDYPLTRVSAWATPSGSVRVVVASAHAVQRHQTTGLEQNRIREGWPRAHAQVQVGAGPLATLRPGPGRSAASSPMIQEGT